MCYAEIKNATNFSSETMDAQGRLPIHRLFYYLLYLVTVAELRKEKENDKRRPHHSHN